MNRDRISYWFFQLLCPRWSSRAQFCTSPLAKKCEENGTKYINSSSDPENSLPFSNSVLRGQTFSNDRPDHSWNSGHST
uniref:Putative sialin n=1 Tax=Ixodes ricinus TaxID=34613 RepID=A0A0K8R6K2_IXORI